MPSSLKNGPFPVMKLLSAAEGIQNFSGRFVHRSLFLRGVSPSCHSFAFKFCIQHHRMPSVAGAFELMVEGKPGIIDPTVS
ncbi:MAG: hypothetical protein M2R45_03536 [Verrucomicrobia subdivision 3 bacterium]|nr:hypothetical protein [Limisphaerales bacterium]MCS1416487.1 hypothetical protein [Limisphaerales bacterium]